ncbi:MAG: hypothetical protein WBL28_03245 [Methylotenera sp.]
MFKRFAVHFVLIFLFAFVQIGAATHEISHFADITKQSQHDKNSHSGQCTQCISFAKVAGGLQAQTFVLPIVNASFIATSSYHFSFQPHLNTAYAARAPPQTISI